jgi:hypothetical protein
MVYGRDDGSGVFGVTHRYITYEKRTYGVHRF